MPSESCLKECRLAPSCPSQDPFVGGLRIVPDDLIVESFPILYIIHASFIFKDLPKYQIVSILHGHKPILFNPYSMSSKAEK